MPNTGARDAALVIFGAVTPEDDHGLEMVILAGARRAGSGVVHVPFVAVDDCGDWPTFVGSGPGAF